MKQTSQTLDNAQLWASRFKKQTDPRAKKYSESISIDRPMFDQNIWGSEAHTIMLGQQEIITDEHCKNILKSLQNIKDDFKSGKWDLQPQEEDLQMNVERYVINDSGIENGGRMHTCRSRNDQVVLDTKMFTRDGMITLLDSVTYLITSLLEKSKGQTETLMPGYTHTQHAQPITYAYWLTHYAAIFLRDLKRILAAYDTVDLNPLGAGAISGTSFPIDRELTTELLGFKGIQEHALDSVGSKDFNLEVLSSLVIMFASISRLADEVIYGITYEFGTMVLDDGFSMGSSMMPQKKNPGVLELVRGRTGKIYGILMHMLTTMKGLPSGYNRDYHEDKTTLSEAITLTTDTISLMGGVIETLTIKPERMEYLVKQNFATATELANYLVRDHNIPFRLCHRIVGHVVKTLVAENKNFEDKERTKELLAEKDVIISDEDYEKTLNPQQVINSHNHIGGVAPEEVDRMIASMLKETAEFQAQIDSNKARMTDARAKTLAIVREITDNGANVKEAVAKVLG
jgi:argininosuccinate lyase